MHIWLVFTILGNWFCWEIYDKLCHTNIQVNRNMCIVTILRTASNFKNVKVVFQCWNILLPIFKPSVAPLIEIRISKFGPKMHLSTVKVPIAFGLDWPWSSVSFLISNLVFSSKLCVSCSFASVCIYLVRPSPVNAAHSTGHSTYMYS